MNKIHEIGFKIIINEYYFELQFNRSYIGLYYRNDIKLNIDF